MQFNLSAVVTKPRPIPPVPVPIPLPIPVPVPVPVPRPRPWPPRKTLVKMKDASSFVNIATDVFDASTYIVGKGIILFTMFYCSMNWWVYKRTREDVEKNDQDENSK